MNVQTSLLAHYMFTKYIHAAAMEPLEKPTNSAPKGIKVQMNEVILKGPW